MTPNDIFRSAMRWLIYVGLHILVVRHWVLFDYAFCFIYLGAIIFLPLEISTTLLLVISFFTGLIIDTFDNTLGLHIIPTVLVAYIRPILIQYQLSQKLGESRLQLSMKSLGIVPFLSYTLILVAVHHIALFLIETGSFDNFLSTLLKIIGSIIFTIVSLILIQIFSDR